MRLYLVERTDNPAQYDITCGVVVRAANETAARALARKTALRQGYDPRPRIRWPDEADVGCSALEHVGVEAVILIDYKAG